MSEEGIDKGATIENFRSLESGILSMLFQSFNSEESRFSRRELENLSIVAIRNCT